MLMTVGVGLLWARQNTIDFDLIGAGRPGGACLFVGLLIGLIFLPKQFFFPVGVAYVLFGIVGSVIKGLLVRQPRLDRDESIATSGEYDAGDFDDDAEEDEQARPRRRRRRRGRSGAAPHEKSQPEGSKE